MNTQAALKHPSFRYALSTLVTIITIISIGLLKLDISLNILLLVCVVVAASSAWWLTRCSFATIRNAMADAVNKAFGALTIFILIGVLIAAFIQAGTISTLIYYGLQFLTPSLLLPAGLIICSLMSLITGTSWGTAGTAGVVLIGIGSAMNIPLPIVAGMIVSGACFGDKMSPMSDTTILASLSSRIDLYAHIKSMMYTTIPTYLITLILFTIIGLNYSSYTIPSEALNQLSEGLRQANTIHWLCLLPGLVMIMLAILRVPAEPTMLAATLSAVLLALFLQDAEFSHTINALYQGGYQSNTGLAALDDLLSRGGMVSMMPTFSLALMGLSLGGILHHFGFLQVIVARLLRSVKSVFSLVTTTILSCFVGNLVMGEAYMSIILGGQTFSPAYDQRNIDRRVLSRSLEEGATLTTTLIPWTTGGAFFAATLGVNVLDYVPWALLNWINAIIAMLFAFFGIAIFRRQSLTI